MVRDTDPGERPPRRGAQPRAAHSPGEEQNPISREGRLGGPSGTSGLGATELTRGASLSARHLGREKERCERSREYRRVAIGACCPVRRREEVSGSVARIAARRWEPRRSQAASRAAYGAELGGMRVGSSVATSRRPNMRRPSAAVNSRFPFSGHVVGGRGADDDVRGGGSETRPHRHHRTTRRAPRPPAPRIGHM